MTVEAAAVSAAGAASAFFSGVLAATGLPVEIELSFATRSETSTTSSASPLPTLSIISCSESTHLKIVSMMSSLILSCSLRSKSSTSSISCVSSAILLYPIVADMPFKVWALRKISFKTDKSPGSFSKLRRPSFSDCKCSRDSSKNISMY